MLKKLIFHVLPVCLALLLVFPAKAAAAGSTEYDVEKALIYAKKNWNSYDGGCITFVARCLRAGGLEYATSSKVSQFVAFLEKNEYGAPFVLETEDADQDGRPDGKSVLRTKENAGKVIPGDVVLWYCNKCKTYVHTGLCGQDVEGYISIYAHNRKEGNKDIMVADCMEHGPGVFMEVHAVHIGSKTAAQPEIDSSVLFLQMGRGEKLPLYVSGFTGDRQPEGCIWSTSDTKVVSTDQAGNITAKKTGEATITATDAQGNPLITCTITVCAAPSHIKFPFYRYTIQVNESLRLQPKISKGSVSNMLQFSSSKPSVAKVDALSGEVTGLQKGVAKITVKTYNGKKGTCLITVVDG